MSFSFLKPVSTEILEQIKHLSCNSIGKSLILHEQNRFPNIDDVKIAILGVLDHRGFQKNSDNYTINHTRLAFYNLFPGNWDFKIADLGDVPVGENVSDTYFVLKNTVQELLKKNILPIIIGGSQDHVYPIYRAFDYKNQLINYVSIDSKLDFEGENKSPADSYLTKMVMNEPCNLFNFANIGFQTYLNAQKEIEIVETLNFDAFRLGEIQTKITLAEPIIRDASIVSIDMNSVKSSDSGNFIDFIPNGYTGKDVCTLSRYAGISESVSCFGIFNDFGTKSESNLISQIVWYFIEGYQYRIYENITVNNTNFKKYIIPFEDLELIFYKSNVTERWWIELNNSSDQDASRENKLVIPCSAEDYQNSLSGDIPERWWKLLKKSMI